MDSTDTCVAFIILQIKNSTKSNQSPYWKEYNSIEMNNSALASTTRIIINHCNLWCIGHLENILLQRSYCVLLVMCHLSFVVYHVLYVFCFVHKNKYISITRIVWLHLTFSQSMIHAIGSMDVDSNVLIYYNDSTYFFLLLFTCNFWWWPNNTYNLIQFP